MYIHLGCTLGYHKLLTIDLILGDRVVRALEILALAFALVTATARHLANEDYREQRGTHGHVVIRFQPGVHGDSR